MDIQNNYTWVNNHQNVQFTAARLYNAWALNDDDPTDFMTVWQKGTACLKKICADAERDNKCVRALGGGWSLSEITITNDYLVNTQPLNMIHLHWGANNFVEGIDCESMVLAQCGACVMEVNQALLQTNKALPTTGASDGQTIAGAIATGTHGAAISVGSMQDYVMGLHIVTASNDDVWIEPTQKILSDTYFSQILPNTRRINDDAVFNAAIVSFGNFGLVHALLLRCEPLYMLSVYQKPVNWGDVRNCLNGPGNFDAIGLQPDVFHFEVVVNYRHLDDTVSMAMYKQVVGGEPTLLPSDNKFGPSADVLTIISQLSNTFPKAIPEGMDFVTGQIKKAYPVRTGETNYPGNIFTSGIGPDLKGAGLSTELGIDANDTVRVADIILDVLQQTPLLGVFSFRFVKGSKATLAFTKFPTSCAIEFPSVLSAETQTFFNVLWDRLDNEGIAYTFHWGQCNNLDAARVRAKWGAAAVDSWISARNLILDTPQKRAMFSNAFLQKCGLDGEVA